MAFKFRARMAPAGSANGRFRRSFANRQFHTAILCDFSAQMPNMPAVSVGLEAIGSADENDGHAVLWSHAPDVWVQLGSKRRGRGTLFPRVD
jgi:hypothetical protein